MIRDFKPVGTLVGSTREEISYSLELVLDEETKQEERLVKIREHARHLGKLLTEYDTFIAEHRLPIFKAEPVYFAPDVQPAPVNADREGFSL